jgi:hypothetical protein
MNGILPLTEDRPRAEGGGRRTETGGRKPEGGNRRAETGGRKPEDGIRKAEFGRPRAGRPFRPVAQATGLERAIMPLTNRLGAPASRRPVFQATRRQNTTTPPV